MYVYEIHPALERLEFGLNLVGAGSDPGQAELAGRYVDWIAAIRPLIHANADASVHAGFYDLSGLSDAVVAHAGHDPSTALRYAHVAMSLIGSDPVFSPGGPLPPPPSPG